jgi:signal peptidase II
MNYGEPISYLHNHFMLIKVENTGAFLSAGNSLSRPLKFILLNAIPLVVILFALGFILTRGNLKLALLSGLILVIGGGFGNVYDRIMHGSVTDFLYINFGIFQTGVFNVADLSITVGVGMILLYSLFEKKESETYD